MSENSSEDSRDELGVLCCTFFTPYVKQHRNTWKLNPNFQMKLKLKAKKVKQGMDNKSIIFINSVQKKVGRNKEQMGEVDKK